MILDDSTSAVDTATDAAIRKGLKEEFGSTTVFIIAQRIGSVQDADKIIVMNDGRIDAVGTHEELLESNKIYREVYYSQQRGSGRAAARLRRRGGAGMSRRKKKEGILSAGAGKFAVGHPMATFKRILSYFKNLTRGRVNPCGGSPLVLNVAAYGGRHLSCSP